MTIPTTPTAVASVSDGDTDDNNNTFDELDGAVSSSTVKIGSDTYALVASRDDDGIQIINMTNPTTPTAVASISDDDTDGDNNAFDELDGASAITTVKIGSDTYALVASSVDDGIQIINITTPAAPTAVDSITDGDTDGDNNAFDELDGASAITTVKIGSDTYALVASSVDDGIQIINMTTPAAPTAVDSITDGDTDGDNNAFDELDGASAITTVKIGKSTYALVASRDDDGIQIINMTIPTTPTAVASVSNGDTDANDNTFDTLDGASDITTTTIGPFTYALVASSDDDAIQIINISNPAAPTAVASSITDGATFDTLGGANAITTVQIDLSIYAIAAGNSDDGIQIIRIAEDQPKLNPESTEVFVRPIAVSSVTDNVDGFDELDGAGAITTVQIDDSTYALVTSILDHGVQIIDITNPKSPSSTFSIMDDTDDFQLFGSFDITTVKTDTSTYALVTSFTDGGVQIIDITDPTMPTAVTFIADGAEGYDVLDGNSQYYYCHNWHIHIRPSCSFNR